jgi:hypothetical protein
MVMSEYCRFPVVCPVAASFEFLILEFLLLMAASALPSPFPSTRSENDRYHITKNTATPGTISENPKHLSPLEPKNKSPVRVRVSAWLQPWRRVVSGHGFSRPRKNARLRELAWKSGHLWPRKLFGFNSGL